MPDIEHLKNQAEEATSAAEDRLQEAGLTDEEKPEGAAAGLKSKFDRDGDGDTDLDDVKTMAKEATDKVKGLFQKK